MVIQSVRLRSTRLLVTRCILFAYTRIAPVGGGTSLRGAVWSQVINQAVLSVGPGLILQPGRDFGRGSLVLVVQGAELWEIPVALG